jgi:hypothetical protein
MAQAIKTAAVEVWVIVDENGDYAVGGNEDQCNESYDNDVNASGARRMVKVTLVVPLPIAMEVKGEVPAEGGEVTLAVV